MAKKLRFGRKRTEGPSIEDVGKFSLLLTPTGTTPTPYHPTLDSFLLLSVGKFGQFFDPSPQKWHLLWMVPETIRFLCLNKLAVHFLALVLTQNHGLLRIWKWKFMSYPSYSTGPKLFCTYSNFFGLVFKVQLFWEGHNLRHDPFALVLTFT